MNFSNFEGAWASLRPHIPNSELKRREHFLGTQHKKYSVQSKRQGVWKSFFFMSQLPDSPFEDSSVVDGEEEVDYDLNRPKKRSKQTADMSVPTAQPMQQQRMQMMQQQQAMQMRMQSQASTGYQMQYPMMAQAPQQMGALRGQADAIIQAPGTRVSLPTNPGSILKHHSDEEYDLEPPYNKPKSSMDTKQFLLHLLSTEMLVNTKLHGEFTVSRSEFQSWFPTLPHSTIMSVLSFFGVSKKWQGFFRKFLEAPLKFAEDGEDIAPRARKRGVPGAHALSSVCGEAILFCLDYAINQATNGAQLYRMHDDFWLWSKDHQTVVKGWQAITTFSDTMGVSLNRGKTGTVRILRDQTELSTLDPSLLSDPSIFDIKQDSAPIDPVLPKGEIRWGFLVMDPRSGRFVIDQDMVDSHVEELKKQLKDKDKSIFAWIQAWNTYAGTFFKANFGKPANCYGREHVDLLLETMKRIQTEIFGDSNVVQYLKTQIGDRFGVKDIPDGYLYFPTPLGGLELQNPFIGLLQVRNSVFESPASALDDFLDSESEAYRKAKIAFEAGKVPRSSPRAAVPANSLEFFSFEEYSKHREEFYYSWEGSLLSVYEELLQQPEKEDVDYEGGLVGESGLAFSKLEAAGMQAGEQRWIAMLFGKEMVERFGGLEIVDRGLLPMGMVGLFRSGRVKWHG